MFKEKKINIMLLFFNNILPLFSPLCVHHREAAGGNGIENDFMCGGVVVAVAAAGVSAVGMGGG